MARRDCLHQILSVKEMIDTAISRLAFIFSRPSRGEGWEGEGGGGERGYEVSIT